MEDARIVDNVIEVLKSAAMPIPAREIVQHLASRGIQIERHVLNQILWDSRRNPRRSEMHVDEKFQWQIVPSSSGGKANAGEIGSPSDDLLALWSLLGFSFLGTRRENKGVWFFFLEEKGDIYRIVGPTGNVLSEERGICSKPEECEPNVFTPEQIKTATEECVRIKRSESLRRAKELFRLVHDSEQLYGEAYIGPLAERVTDYIPLDALLVIAPIRKMLDTDVTFGLAAVFAPIYLVVDVVGLNLEHDDRYGVFRLCAYELIKKNYLCEVNEEGMCCMVLKYHADKVYIKGPAGPLLLA
jgi:hypothetical protein